MRLPFLFAALLPVAGVAAGTPSFQAKPVVTADQQAAINRYGNLSVAEVIYHRCASAFAPPVTEAQQAGMSNLFLLSKAEAKGALHAAYPLDKPDSFDPYLESYQHHESAAANAAIDQGGCDDQRVQWMIALLKRFQRELPASVQ